MPPDVARGVSEVYNRANKGSRAQCARVDPVEARFAGMGSPHMGLILLAICIGAAVNLSGEGAVQTVAIVVAVLNGLSLVGQMGEARRGEPAGATSALNMLTALAGLGLLLYSFVF